MFKMKLVTENNLPTLYLGQTEVSQSDTSMKIVSEVLH